MLWIKALHLLFMIAWFSGLFYLPRLFVYHAGTNDAFMQERFLRMERKLYYGLLNCGAIGTLFFGAILLYLHRGTDLKAHWLHLKLGLVFLLFAYQLYLRHCLRQFACKRNRHSAVFYRWLNEVPSLFLVAVVLLVVLKPPF